MKNRDKSNFFYALSLVFQLGFLIAIPLIGFLLIGIFLDGKFDSSPLFIFVSLLFSFVFLFFEVRYYLRPLLTK